MPKCIVVDLSRQSDERVSFWKFETIPEVGGGHSGNSHVSSWVQIFAEEMQSGGRASQR